MSAAAWSVTTTQWLPPSTHLADSHVQSWQARRPKFPPASQDTAKQPTIHWLSQCDEGGFKTQWVLRPWEWTWLFQELQENPNNLVYSIAHIKNLLKVRFKVHVESYWQLKFWGRDPGQSTYKRLYVLPNLYVRLYVYSYEGLSTHMWAHMCSQTYMGARLCSQTHALICALVYAPKLVWALVCAPKFLFKKKIYIKKIY